MRAKSASSILAKLEVTGHNSGKRSVTKIVTESMWVYLEKRHGIKEKRGSSKASESLVPQGPPFRKAFL